MLPDAVRWRRVNGSVNMSRYASYISHRGPAGRFDPRALLPIWTAKAETARRVRQRVRTVLSWVQAHGFTSGNVAAEGIDGALPKGNGRKKHFRALPYHEVGEALATVDASPASPAARLCFRFLVLTAARSGEARGARWSEMDREAREWRIPSGRTKTGAPHRVPLSAEAMAVLERARPRRPQRAGVSGPPARAGVVRHDPDEGPPGQRGGGPRDRPRVPVGVPRLVRGDRSAAGGCGGGAGAHRRGVEGAYFRSDPFERRRALMESWDAFLAD